MRDHIHSLIHNLKGIHAGLLQEEARWQPVLNTIHPKQRASALNLLHYLRLRCEDLRDLQDDLHQAGLSSLASAESHTLQQVQSVLQRLGQTVDEQLAPCDFPEASRLMQLRANALFGSKVNPHIPHIMVTFDTGLAADYDRVKALVQAGMNVARINCAHDDPTVWSDMIEQVRKASRATGHPCKIYLDLAGPKIRTQLLGKGRKKSRMKVKKGEKIWLCEPEAKFEKTEKILGCTQAGVVTSLRAGDRVLFDDGLFESVVENADGQKAQLRITRISAEKPRIKPEKGINFPDTDLQVRSLTAFDKSIIPFAREHADLLGFSFVRQPSEVEELQSLLRDGHDPAIPLLLKIETYEAVQNLPALLLQSMREPVFGIMIARGDLAVEIGFERLSEIQEEILWICEAAHVPVVWATQVLESLNKSGIATRSEVSDAALAAHAECVMLNKGKHLLAVLSSLRDILRRSGGHHLKKRYVFRPLAIAERHVQVGPPKGETVPVSSNGSHRRSRQKTGTR